MGKDQTTTPETLCATLCDECVDSHICLLYKVITFLLVMASFNPLSWICHLGSHSRGILLKSQEITIENLGCFWILDDIQENWKK